MASINRGKVYQVISGDIYLSLSEPGWTVCPSTWTIKSSQYSDYDYRRSLQRGVSYQEWKKEEAEKKALGLKRFL